MNEGGLRDQARRVWQAGVAAADPLRLVPGALRAESGALVAGDRRIPLSEIDRILIVGAGKASARMAMVVESVLGRGLLRERRVHGWVNVPDAAVRSLRAVHLHGARSSHDNLPTRAGWLGARRIVALLQGLGPRDLAIALVSGGGSALLPLPAPGVSLVAKRRLVAALHSAGATIGEVNVVRKHLSAVKGGGLVRGFRGSRMVSLILSDVVGDRLDVIASGPTVPDPSTFAEAIDVLERYGVWRGAAEAVRSALLDGRAGRRPETLKALPPNVENLLVGSVRNALDGASAEARRLGYRVVERSDLLHGEAAEAGRALAAAALDVRLRHRPGPPPICILAGGETTVRLGPRHGRGGRAQETVLAALATLGEDGLEGMAFLCAGTDGEDGSTDAAGAVVDRRIAARARARGWDPSSFLGRHDACSFFEPLGALIRTGMTGTNVMDLAVILIRPAPSA